MKNKIALIVGRFQPFHKGHLFLIKKALEKADKIIIGIGSANIIDENNPIDFETRKKIIKAVAYKEKFEDRLIKIVYLDDFFDDKKWLANLKKQAGKFDLSLGNNEWTNNILEKAGYKVLKVDYFKRGMYEGWRIRKLIKEGRQWHNRVPNYLIKAITDYGLRITKFNHVVLGGTFDHFHKGHEVLIEKAIKIGKKLTIGVATEEIYKNKFLSETIESYEDRKKSVEKLVNKKEEIISFSDFTGGADKKKDIDAIIVSKETFPNALKINELREKNILKPLMIIILDDILAEDGKLISSERIRAGEIDRKGNNYELRITDYGSKNNKEIKMPEELRPLLQKPLGIVYKNTKQLVGTIHELSLPPTMIVAVGDIIVDSLLKEGIDPDVKVIDNRSRRKSYIRSDPFLSTIEKGQTLINNPGTINLKTAEALRQMIRKRSVLVSESTFKVGPYYSWLVVEGEEDLLTLPAILFAPLNSLVLYGHWEHGIIAVEVDEEIKNKVRKIIKKFN